MTGLLNLVSVGPGFAEHITPSASQALTQSEAIVGYDLYLKWIAELIADKEHYTTPLTQEKERAQIALDLARAGKKVSLVSSGDIGVYAMASLAFDEMREDDDFAVNVVPGVTAANACASLLGAPLSHDFATLSLSDLLCPWDWIEQRANHIAAADLAVALYNVQSKQRQNGVYRILEIMLAHKDGETVCGIVRNAYRPDQTVEVRLLRELPEMQFDMLTTIVIGNRFTRRRRNWIFTPRGYNNWTESNGSSKDTAKLEERAIPEEAIWIFSGTSDGNALSNVLAASGRPIVISASSAYGEAVALNSCQAAYVLSGKLGIAARKNLLERSKAKVIVDATHPYATEMSRQLMALSSELGIPYVRFERPSLCESDEAHVCENFDEAAKLAINIGTRIFLSTGSKDVQSFLTVEGASERTWFVRITPDNSSIERVVDAGIPRERICAMQGPFSRQFNETLWREWQIDCLVTKDSGTAGGYESKMEAAKALNIPVIVIRRPKIDYPHVVTEADSLLAWLNKLEL
jgi:precorrin-3B C17-methyltransferase